MWGKNQKAKEATKSSLDGAVLAISENPTIGEPIVGDLAGVYVYRFEINKQLKLLAYQYNDVEFQLLNVSPHEIFYAT
ncbi:MAG: type II toxin-antitoxin system RelE/ParE family toxin [Rubritalea sp.]|uniref:type II toxin-antitoxin system RelE/ParE family toxin n=1 Tax=Rubritalea sp. TaxID=2109375 RepID=UPI003242D777